MRCSGICLKMRIQPNFLLKQSLQDQPLFQCRTPRGVLTPVSVHARTLNPPLLTFKNIDAKNIWPPNILTPQKCWPPIILTHKILRVGGQVTPFFSFFSISSRWVKICLHAKNKNPRLSRSLRKVVTGEESRGGERPLRLLPTCATPPVWRIMHFSCTKNASNLYT